MCNASQAGTLTAALRRLTSGVTGRKPTPHPAELVRGLPMPKREGGVVGRTGHPSVRQPHPGGLPPARANQVRGDWSCPRSTFELVVPAHGRSPASSLLLCSLFSDAPSLPHAAHLDPPRPRGWESVGIRCRTLCTAFGIRSQDYYCFGDQIGSSASGRTCCGASGGA